MLIEAKYIQYMMQILFQVNYSCYYIPDCAWRQHEGNPAF